VTFALGDNTLRMTVPARACKPAARAIWKRGLPSDGSRSLAEETPVALSYDGATHAVLLATPHDLDDFALGFSITEGVVAEASEIEMLDIVDHADGIELRMELAPSRREILSARRRRLVGPSGCGLCGIASLFEATRPPPRVMASARFAADEVSHAVASLAGQTPLGDETRAVHAAGFWHPQRGLVALREDVGRHNALDKLAGALSAAGEPAGDGIVVLTSRVSVELVQKAARIGAGVLAAMSAPTALAVRTAREAGITLVAVARHDGFELFVHPERIARTAACDSVAA
jgi:FdhD protein